MLHSGAHAASALHAEGHWFESGTPHHSETASRAVIQSPAAPPSTRCKSNVGRTLQSDRFSRGRSFQAAVFMSGRTGESDLCCSGTVFWLEKDGERLSKDNGCSANDDGSLDIENCCLYVRNASLDIENVYLDTRNLSLDIRKNYFGSQNRALANDSV
jgi:hypothetical protein